MPKAFTYTKGQVVTLRVEVLDDRDSGAVVVRLGSVTIPVNARDLDAADVRDVSERPLTEEEEDLRELQQEEAQLERERQVELRRVRLLNSYEQGGEGR